MAFIITYGEYQHHYPDKAMPRKLAIVVYHYPTGNLQSRDSNGGFSRQPWLPRVHILAGGLRKMSNVI